MRMIHEVEGDILQTGAAAIAQGVAANDPMKQGLAAALHERYPRCTRTFTIGAGKSTRSSVARGSGAGPAACV